MEFRRMENADKPQVLWLWQETFGDSAKDTALYVTQFVGEQNLFVADDNGVTCAILSAVPCMIYEKKGVYFFALATAVAWRGQGVMQRLMQYAETVCAGEGCVFSCLVPASRSLFCYYERHGYKTLNQRKIELAIEKTEGKVPFVPLTKQELFCLRAQHGVDDCITLQDSACTIALLDAAEAGYKIAKNNHAYAVFSARGQVLLVAEMVAEHTVAAQRLLREIGATMDCQTAVVHLPNTSPLFHGQGIKQVAAQWKALQDGWVPPLVPRLYFTLDSLFEKDYDSV